MSSTSGDRLLMTGSSLLRREVSHELGQVLFANPGVLEIGRRVAGACQAAGCDEICDHRSEMVGQALDRRPAVEILRILKFDCESLIGGMGIDLEEMTARVA